MEKKKRSMKKVQTGSTFHENEDASTPKEMKQASKDGKAIYIVVRKFLAEYWLWLTKHKYEVLSGFFVAVASVYIAFWLSGIGEQKTMDTATKQRLYLAGFEAKFNLETAEEIKEIINNKGDIKHVRINVRRLGSAAAVAALQDSNLLSILSGEKVILLGSYVNEIQTFNQCLQTYQQALENQDFKNTNPVNGMRKLVLYNADAVCAIVYLLREEVTECFDDKLYDFKKIKKMRERLNDIKAKYPKDEEISASKKD